MRAGSCSVCDHPERAALELAHISGAPIRALAVKYGRDKATINKHVRDHIPAAAQKAAEMTEAREIDAGQRILSELEKLLTRTDRLLVRAETKKDLRNGFAGVREMRGLLTDIAKVLGVIRDREITITNVTIDPETALRVADMYRARRAPKTIAADCESAPRSQVIENEREK